MYFIIPLYTITFVQTFAWIYGMFLYSDYYQDFKKEVPFFNNVPKTFLDHFGFFAGLSFFHGLTTTAGHELVHHKNWMHKIVGTIPYTQFCYSHFWQEHTHCHHKDIGTKYDAVSHEIGTSLYKAIPDAFIRTHTATWDREVERIQKKLDKECLSLFEKIVYNAMTGYFLIHTAMFGAIYYLFGYGGLKY